MKYPANAINKYYETVDYLYYSLIWTMLFHLSATHVYPTGCATRYKLVRFTLSNEELLREAAKGLQVGPIHKTQQ
jgi:hypothetical protein